MKRIDISRELFAAPVYPGDPPPTYTRLLTHEAGQNCQLTALSLSAHAGTHIDAPLHFLHQGTDIAQLSLERCIGDCTVTDAPPLLTQEAAQALVRGAQPRLLLRGEFAWTEAGAAVLAAHCLLVGVEGQTVGAADAPAPVHRILLQRDVVILEGLDLSQAAAGQYLLCAAPLKIAGCDGAPCRAVLLTID